MQEPFRNKKSRGYRLRPASGRDRLDSRVRRICSRLGILAVVVAAAIVIRSLYNIQIVHGAEYRQYAAQQQLLDTTIKATRGEIYDASGITLASTSVVWTIWADPSYSSILYTSKTNIASVEETAGRLGLMKVDPSQITYIRLGESGALVRRESTVRQWTDFLYTGAVNILGTVR